MADSDGSRIEELLTVIAKATLAPVIREELSDKRMEKLYEMTGSKTAAEACKVLKMSNRDVSDAWKRWERVGLLIRDGKQYRKAI